jgi:hypothetical protein
MSLLVEKGSAVDQIDDVAMSGFDLSSAEGRFGVGVVDICSDDPGIYDSCRFRYGLESSTGSEKSDLVCCRCECRSSSPGVEERFFKCCVIPSR